MSFATRCPNCNALFRVSEEQLRSHDGLVRCGDCRHVFDARSRLEAIADDHPDAPAPPRRDAPIDREPKIPPSTDAPVDMAHDMARDLPTDMPTGRAGEPDFPEPEQPDFLRADKRRAGGALRATLAAACTLLALTLLAQLAIQFRADLLANLPSLRPTLDALCAPLACRATLPMRPDLLAIVSSDLQAIPNTSAMEFDAVIRNRAPFAMALPSIELTLTNAQDHAIARKVFSPSDYGPTSNSLVPPDNLPPGADRSIRILFVPPGPGATGFVAYPFFP